MNQSLTLVEKQRLFVRLLAEWVQWAYAMGWELTLGEGYVGDSIDRPEEDTPHLRQGLHFSRLAQDWNLWVDGEYITDGDHPAWREAGVKWEGLHPLCRWGGRFGDANHLSLEHGGRA